MMDSAKLKIEWGKVLLLLLNMCLLTYNANGEIKEHSFYFSNLNYQNGIPSDIVTAMVQDESGFLWIGTEDGLCRYDGYNTTVFKSTKEVNSIPFNGVTSLLLDGDLLWVGTWNGLCTINVKSFEVRRVNIGSLISVRVLYKERSGNLWVGCSQGLLFYRKDIDQYRFFNVSNSNISHSTIRSINQTENGDVWVGTYDGLNRFRNGKFEQFNLKGNYKPLLKNNLILDIEPFSQIDDTKLWVGTETGLCLFDTETGAYKHYSSSNTALSNEVIKCIYNDGRQLWLGTDFGLNVFSIASGEIKVSLHNPEVNYSIVNNVVNEIFEDKHNLLWFLTSDGISRLNISNDFLKLSEEIYSFSNQVVGNQIRDVLVDDDGTIWLATIHGVIKKRSGDRRKTFSVASSNVNERLLLDNVNVLMQDSAKRIWIGTAGGLNIYDNSKGRMYAVTADEYNGLTSNYISGFGRCKNGSIWLSTWEGGLFQVTGNLDNLQNLHFELMDKEGEGRFVIQNDLLFYSRNNRLWCMDAITRKKSAVKELDACFNYNDITALNSDSEGGVWAAFGNEIYCYRVADHSVKKYMLPIGSDVKIISIEKDGSNNLWMASSNAIIKFDLISKEIVTLPLSSNTPLKRLQTNCSVQNSDGKLFFGGVNGYVELDPFQLGWMGVEPSVFISDVAINNVIVNMRNVPNLLKNNVAYCSELLLPHSSNSLLFYFSTLDFWMPQKNRYRYRLLNYDDEWQYSAAGTNFASYSKLSPGDYVLEVFGINHNGVESEKSYHLNITIQPPFWLSKPILILYLILIGALVYYIFKIYHFRQKLKGELNIMKVEKLHSEELLQAKQQFFTNVSHEFRTPLSLIEPPLAQVLESDTIDSKNKKLLALAYKNSKRLHKLVNQILDFRKMENSELQIIKKEVDLIRLCTDVYHAFSDLGVRNNIHFDFKHQFAHLPIFIDEEKVETVLFNLLSNAYKYTPENGSIEIALSVKEESDKKMAVIKIRDTGEGVAVEEQDKIFNRFFQSTDKNKLKAGSGIGLTLALEYVNLHDGKLTLESELGKGTIFTIQLPLDTEIVPLSIESNSIMNSVLTQVENMPNDDADERGSTIKKILVVDDNEDILDYISMNFSSEYNIYKAFNGQQGLEMAMKIVPDMIVSDVMMPLMDGLTFCQFMKNDAKTSHIPIILLTAKSLENQKVEGLDIGADLYITKPFDINFLKSSIESLFRRELQLFDYIKKTLLLNPVSEPLVANNQDELFLKKVISIVEKNLSNSSLSVELIGAEIGISATHLYRKLKGITNQSTKDIVKNYRLQKAAQMLQNKEGNVTEVMYAVGFSSLSAFSKSFKMLHGLSPSEFIRNNMD